MLATGPNADGGWLEINCDEIQPSCVPHRTGVQPADAFPRIVTSEPKASVVITVPERLGWVRQFALAAPAVSM